MNGIDKLAEAIRTDKSTQPYDTRAEVVRVSGSTAYVHIPGGVAETPVTMTIACKKGDTVQVRVSGGRAWIVGNETAPPTDDAKAKEVEAQTELIKKRMTGVEGQYSEFIRTSEYIRSVVSDGDKLASIINQSAGEVLIKAEKISLDGYTKISEGEIGGFKTIKGDSGCAAKTTADGGHAYPTSFYKQMDDGTYEYEVGMKGDNNPGYLNFYVKRMTKGGAWSSASNMFYVNNSGKLYTKNAEIDDVLKITKGTMTAQLDGAELKFTDSRFSNYMTKIGYGITSFASDTHYIGLSGGALDAKSGQAWASINGNTVDVGIDDGTYNRQGRLTASAGGNIGLYDIQNGEYIIYSNSSRVVVVPHNLNATTVTTYNGNYKPVGSYGTDGRRVAYVSARIDSAAFQFRVNGQWGDTGDNYSVKTIWSSSVSDIRLKQNIENTDVNGLDAVNQMQMRQFDWIRDGKHQPIGFVADELETIDPDLALGGGYDEDGNIDEKQVNTYMVVAYLTKAVQELSAKVEELEERLSTMEENCHGHS